jgi:hypothetical protein
MLCLDCRNSNTCLTQVFSLLLGKSSYVYWKNSKEIVTNRINKNFLIVYAHTDSLCVKTKRNYKRSFIFCVMFTN